MHNLQLRPGLRDWTSPVTLSIPIQRMAKSCSARMPSSKHALSSYVRLLALRVSY